jgi:hypothetical protein
MHGFLALALTLTCIDGTHRRNRHARVDILEDIMHGSLALCCSGNMSGCFSSSNRGTTVPNYSSGEITLGGDAMKI